MSKLPNPLLFAILPDVHTVFTKRGRIEGWPNEQVFPTVC